MWLIGIDDAGRGPLIGSMIVAGVLIQQDKESELKNLGAKDSKLLAHSARIKLSSLIESESQDNSVIKISPQEIDSAVLGKENLNTLEARKMAEVINKLNDKKKKIRVIVDCPSVNIVKWRLKLLSFIEYKENLEVVCEHKADFNHPVVSAASILAKVAREDEVDKIKREYGNIGSGYPSDPVTKQFLKEQGSRLKDSGIFRKSWATWTEMFPQDKKQKDLLDY